MNKDKLKKEIDQIHASEELKQKTFERITTSKSKNKILPFKRALAACAVIMIMFSVVTLYFGKNQNNENKEKTNEGKQVAIAQADLPRIQNIEQLKEIIETDSKRNNYYSDFNDVLTDAVEEAESVNSTVTKGEGNSTDYSTTNVQVENVDEADIVKTDGKYIYYVRNGKIYIIDAKKLKIISEIDSTEKEQKFRATEIFINKDRLIAIGNNTTYNENLYKNYAEDIVIDITYERYTVETKYMTTAIVFDISDRKNPEKVREVAIEGSYKNSRMIGDNVYLISQKYISYYRDLNDSDILPVIKDTVDSDEEKSIECTDIAYFEDCEDYNYIIVAGFNINNNKEANFETILGSNNIVYASENNLYLAQTKYSHFTYQTESVIYKFKLDDSKINIVCKGEVKGSLNNQFSLDEYKGNLRVATTNNTYSTSTNQLYILDENLNEIGKVEDLAKGERIYSVRFIGKTGYIVTFKQIDPLFVIDLSDPTDPQVTGELKIPGYSSYLHPYDETHIIGIGYNTTENKYGNTTNTTMKMSMFDISDIENPKEMFNVEIGDERATSAVTSNHKVLFYKESDNLIGFPVTYTGDNYSSRKNGFVIYKIDLNNGFEEYGEILEKNDYLSNVQRIIYIEDTLYALSNSQIKTYDLDTMKELDTLDLD